MTLTRSLRLGAFVLAALLAACAQVTKVASGETVLRNRLAVTVTTPWNQFERGMGDNTPVWTTEGITVDALQFYVGLKDGELIAPTPSEPKGTLPLAYKAGMQPADVVSLYQGLWTRDGSSFALEKLEPAEFLGGTGFRFEYTLTRKLDEVRLRGVAWGALRNGELFLINYSAPRLGFYARGIGQVEALVKTAKVKA
jgi:hypothetical protein